MSDQARLWSDAAEHYEREFIDPYLPDVQSPLQRVLEGLAGPGDRAAVAVRRRAQELRAQGWRDLPQRLSAADHGGRQHGRGCRGCAQRDSARAADRPDLRRLVGQAFLPCSRLSARLKMALNTKVTKVVF